MLNTIYCAELGEYSRTKGKLREHREWLNRGGKKHSDTNLTGQLCGHWDQPDCHAALEHLLGERGWCACVCVTGYVVIM